MGQIVLWTKMRHQLGIYINSSKFAKWIYKRTCTNPNPIGVSCHLTKWLQFLSIPQNVPLTVISEDISQTFFGNPLTIKSVH